jgi:hypothetical protein
MNVLREKESRRRMASESGLLYDLLGYDTADSQVDLHAVLQAKGSVHGVEHRTQSEMDGSALGPKLQRTLSISRGNTDPGQQPY